MSTMDAAPLRPEPIHRGALLYSDRYAWYVLVSAMDVMVTVKLLVHLGMREEDVVDEHQIIAREANTFAQWTIDQFGTWGLIGLKFLSVILVVAICEYVGRRNQRAGRRLAFAAIFLSLIPVAAALVQVAYLTATGELVVEP